MSNSDLWELVSQHLPLTNKGKVRMIYTLPQRKNDDIERLLVVCSDRTSIYDFVLGSGIPGKGEVLNAMNIAARLFLREKLPALKQDLVAFGVGIDPFLPEELRGNTELQLRAVVVEKLTMIPVECVVRGHLTGSGYRAYEQTGKVCGLELRPGLVEGSTLTVPIFTPTTKAHSGHDEPLDYRQVANEYGPSLEGTSLAVFQLLHMHALKQVIIGVDTKFEFGRSGSCDGALVLADEVWTTDSSRFWDLGDYNTLFPKALPPSKDKQVVRNWGREFDMHTRDPKNPDDIAYVQNLRIPLGVIEKYQFEALTLFEYLWGVSLTEFQYDTMRVGQ